MGVHVTVLDMLILCLPRNKNMVCVMRDNDDLCARPVAQIISEVKNVTVADLSADPDFGDKDTWFLLATRADFKKGEFLTLNHFQPGWHKKQLSAEDWDECQVSTVKDLMLREGKNARDMEALLKKAKKMDPIDFAAWQNSLEEEKEQLQDESQAVKDFLSLDIHMENVPADGNCGLWTMLSWENGFPAAVLEDPDEHVSRNRIAQLRKETSH